MSRRSLASMQLNPYCCISIAAASFRRFSRKAFRTSAEMVFPVRSNGINESFIKKAPFLVILLVSIAKGITAFSHHAAAGLYILSRDPARGVAGEKCRDVGHFLRRAYAIEGRQARAVFAGLLGQDVRVGEDWRQDVHAHIARTQLTGKRTGELLHCRLAAEVKRRIGKHHLRASGGN